MFDETVVDFTVSIIRVFFEHLQAMWSEIRRECRWEIYPRRYSRLRMVDIQVFPLWIGDDKVQFTFWILLVLHSIDVKLKPVFDLLGKDKCILKVTCKLCMFVLTLNYVSLHNFSENICSGIPSSPDFLSTSYSLSK